MGVQGEYWGTRKDKHTTRTQQEPPSTPPDAFVCQQLYERGRVTSIHHPRQKPLCLGFLSQLAHMEPGLLSHASTHFFLFKERVSGSSG